MVDEEMEEMEKCNRTGECSESVASTVCAHNICLLRRVPRYINRPPEHTSPHRHHTPEPPARNYRGDSGVEPNRAILATGSPSGVVRR